MRTAMILGLLLALAGSASAGERRRFTYLVPDGTDLEMLVDRIREPRTFADAAEAEAWKEVVRDAGYRFGESGRFDLSVRLPDGADPEALDRIVTRCFEAYRNERLAALPVLIEKAKADLADARKKAANLRSGMAELLEHGAGVVDRARAIAASAERTEDLRRRIVDARMELAVIEARIRGIREQVKARKIELEVWKSERLAEMERELEQMVERQQLSPKALEEGERRDGIERFRRQPIPEDELLTALLRRTADLEIERIAGEERVKVLGRSLDEEKDRSLRLLDVTDLESFRKSRLVPAEKEVADRAQTLETLQEELAAVRSGATPQRLTPDPGAGDLPRVYVLGAVNRPGTFLYEEAGSSGPMTLTKLLALAGDVGDRADTSRIRIVRKENGRALAVEVDLGDILDDTIQDVGLRPEDIVYVPEKPR